MIWLLTSCLGTYVPPITELGPYELTVPDGQAPVPTGAATGDSMVLARFGEGTAPSDPRVVVTRPAAAPGTWAEGGLPPSIIATREALTPIEYRGVRWLGDRASLGQMTMPDGSVLSTWAAVRDGWLHELQCSTAAGEEGVESCYVLAAGVKLTGALAPLPPLPTATRLETAGPLQVPIPEGWLLAPVDSATPELLLKATPPPPTDPKASREMGRLAVEVYPDMRLLGTWVVALQETYGKTGMKLLHQQPFKGKHGESFLCEYTDGLSTTFTYDAVTAAGMVHLECSDNTTRSSDLRTLCRNVFQGVIVENQGG